MHFLDPIPALLAAAVCVPALLALYLLKLRRRPVRVGSVMFWPKAAEDVQANVPLRWIRPSLLLLLHLLVLGCLLAAFARPAIHATGGAGDRVILLIDASASMSAEAGPGASPGAPPTTRLDLAKARAKEISRDLLAGLERRRVSVVSFASEARMMAMFTPSASIAGAAIDAIEATDQPGDLGAALRLVEALAMDSGTEAGSQPSDDPGESPTVILLSDGSFGPSEKTTTGGLRLSLEAVPSPDAVGGASEGRDAPVNLAIVAMGARRDADDPLRVRVLVRVRSNGTEAIEAPLALAIDGEVIERRVVRLPARAARALGGPSGESGGASSDAEDEGSGVELAFDVPSAPEGVLSAVIDRGDALLADNAASVVLPAPARASITLVRDAKAQLGAGDDAQGNAPSSPRSTAEWLLTDALEELAPGRLAIASLDEWNASGQPRPESGPSLVIFDGCTPTQPPPMGSLWFGGLPQGESWSIEPGELRPREGSIYWDRSHPLLAGASLDTLRVGRAMRVRVGLDQPRAGGGPTDRVPTPQATSSAAITPITPTTPTTLAGSDDWPLILTRERPGAVRDVVVAFDLLDSNWPLQASFPVFLANAVEWLTGQDRAFQGRFVRTGEAARVRTGGANAVTLVGPTTLELVGNGTSEAIDVGLVQRAGVYVLRGGGRGADRALPVNLFDETESDLRTPGRLELGGKPIAGVEPPRVPREVWHWFVLAALALLVIEWLVYARQVRV